MRLIRNILVALLTFFLGVVISHSWNVQTIVKSPSQTAIDPLRVSVCDLLNEPEVYRNKRVILEGVLYSTDTALLVYENCPKVKEVAIGFEDISDDVASLLDDLDGLRQRGKMEVDVRVVGEIDEFYTVDEDPYLHIVVKKLELLSPLRKFRLRGAA